MENKGILKALRLMALALFIFYKEKQDVSQAGLISSLPLSFTLHRPTHVKAVNIVFIQRCDENFFGHF